MKFFFALLFIASVAAHAQSAQYKPIKPVEAEAFRKELRSIVDQSTAALSKPERVIAHSRRIDAAVKKATVIFGDGLHPEFGSCVKAATYIQSNWRDQLALSKVSSASGAGKLAQYSFEAGIEYWSCRAKVDELTPMPKGQIIDLSKPAK
jgi:hypothetical protein